MISRRGFLQRSMAALAGPQIVNSAVLGKTGPGNRLALGFIGLGSRGRDHVWTFAGRPEVELVAFCDVYRSKVENALNILKDPGAAKGLTRNVPVVYQDFRELLARGDIDAVVIASPENWHALHSLSAMRAGKDVYCEKGLARTIAEGRAVAECVRRRGRVFQVGMQQRSWGLFRHGCELVRNGYIGKVHTVRVSVPAGRALPEAPPTPAPADLDYDLWLGPAPYTPHNDLKGSFNWYFINDYCAGWIQSWGVHHIDIAQWGVPTFSQGRIKVKGTADFPSVGLGDTSTMWDIEYTSSDGVKLFFTYDTKQPTGCRFEGEAGWVHVERNGIKTEPAGLAGVNLKPGDEHLYFSDDHHSNFVACVRDRKDPAANVDIGHSANTLTLIADIATRVRKELTWDWTTERFVDCDEANRLLSRPMRAPWHV